ELGLRPGRPGENPFSGARAGIITASAPLRRGTGQIMMMSMNAMVTPMAMRQPRATPGLSSRPSPGVSEDGGAGEAEEVAVAGEVTGVAVVEASVGAEAPEAAGAGTPSKAAAAEPREAAETPRPAGTGGTAGAGWPRGARAC